MKIIFLVTNEPGKMCGVCDYTQQLAAALSSSGVQAVAEIFPSWTLKAVLDVRKKYAGQKDVIFHLQYPSMGMGNSIWPGMMPFLFGPSRTFVTLHEFSIFHFLRKAIFLPFLIFSKIVFTNDYERNFFHRLVPFFKNRTSVIPIGNNIALAGGAPGREKRIVYFGQVTEGKGIEDYIETLDILSKKNVPHKAMLVGIVLKEDSAVAKEMYAARDRLGLDLHLGLPGDDVSRRLQTASIAIMPFADGLSEKRGSALACLKHGLALITRHSEKTPQWMRECSYHMNSPAHAAEIAAGLLDGSMPDLSGEKLEREMAMREWPAIAKQHLDLYAA